MCKYMTYYEISNIWMPDCLLEVSGHLNWPDVGELKKVCGFPESCSKC